VNDLPDPKRLRELAAPGSTLERALVSARDRGPSDHQLRALQAALFGGALGGVAASAKAGTSAWRFAGLTKTVGVLAVAGAVTGAGGLAWHHHRATRSNQRVSSHVSSENLPATPSVSPQVTPPELPPPAPPAKREVPSPAQPRRKAPVNATPIEKPADQAADDELQLIGAAQAALPGDPTRALALVRQLELRYPAGLLGQEREVIAVSALWQSGQREEARRRAARFTVEHPGSTYAARMRQIIEGGQHGSE
jgi:hypothetical protein